MKKDRDIQLVVKIIFVILCLVGICTIGCYRVPNQDLKLSIITDVGMMERELEANSLSIFMTREDENRTLDIITYDWIQTGASELKEIKIYRFFKSIAIFKIDENSIWKYGYIDDDGVHFNAKGIRLLYESSTSFLLERMIFAEIWVAFIAVLWIVVKAVVEKTDSRNGDNHGPIYEISLFIKNIKKYREYIVYAAKSDLNAEVANSYLNRLWWVLEPFCNMLVYVVVFGNVMGNSIERYATFVFSALLMWNYFSHILNYSVKCIRNNRDIVTKIYVPKYILLLTNMVLNFIKLLFSMSVLIIMLIIFKNAISWAVLWIVPAYILMLILSFGIGMILLHFGVFIDDLGYAISILITLLMFLSGIFYDVISTLTIPLNHILIACNPVVTFVDAMRNALLYQKVTDVPLVITWTVLGLYISYLGVHIVNKNENGYVKVI